MPISLTPPMTIYPNNQTFTEMFRVDRSSGEFSDLENDEAIYGGGKNDINQLNISEYGFYWPYGDRTKIESILKKESDGTFCLRRAKDDSLCLTFKHRDIYHLKLIEKNGDWRIGVGHTFPNVKEFFDALQSKTFEIKYLNQSRNNAVLMLQFYLERDLRAIESRKVPRPAPRIKTKPKEKQFLLTGTLDKLSEGWGRKKWNSRYFVLEAHWLNYYHDDEKNGVVTNIDMKQVQNVTILSEHQSRENVLAVTTIDKTIYLHNSNLANTLEWQKIIHANKKYLDDLKACRI